MMLLKLTLVLSALVKHNSTLSSEDSQKLYHKTQLNLSSIGTSNMMDRQIRPVVWEPQSVLLITTVVVVLGSLRSLTSLSKTNLH